MKRYLQHDKEFGDIAPAGVAIWDRLLAYGAALGVARGAAAAIHSRWKTPTWRGVASAVTGIRCTSSTRRASVMASAPSPSSSTARSRPTFGVFAFLGLPIVVDIVWKAGSDAVDTTSGAAAFAFVVLFAAVAGAIGVTLVGRVADGAVCAYRGAAHLRSSSPSPGRWSSITTSRRCRGSPSIPEMSTTSVHCVRTTGAHCRRAGATVRAVITPHLRHVVSVDVIDDVQP